MRDSGGAVTGKDVFDRLFAIAYSFLKSFEVQRIGVWPDAAPMFFTGNDSTRIPDFSTKIVLQNVPILARTLAVYTIRTDAQTAEMIGYLSAAGGTLNLLLRAGQDQRQAATSGVTFGAAYKRFGFTVPGKIAP